MSANWLERCLGAIDGGACAAGVLSGTSADGIDVALVRAPRAPGAIEAGRASPWQLVSFATLPFEPALGARVQAALAEERAADFGARGLALLDRELGLAFGAAARAQAERAGVELALVASHGQTIWHHDGRGRGGARASLQLGDGDFVCESARACCASDFRQRDLAAGGEGAPILALVEAQLYPRLARPGAVLNLGGIANLTLLDARGALSASFDVGPCGALLDALARELLGAPLDLDGRAAARGRAHAGLVAELLRLPFLAEPPPKSTGRNTFDARFASGVIARGRALGLSDSDLLASAVEFVAASVADALERFAREPVQEVVLAGGGARHPGLAAALARRCAARVRDSRAHGLDAKAREAVGFALLGLACLRGEPLSASAATGARAGRVLGKLSPWTGLEGA